MRAKEQTELAIDIEQIQLLIMENKLAPNLVGDELKKI